MTAERPRAYKPDVRMYLQAPQMLNLEPHEVMMCAAHLLDLKAAAVGGLRTAFVARPNEYGAPPNKYYTAETEAGPGVDGHEGHRVLGRRLGGTRGGCRRRGPRLSRLGTL